jgi:hypothetical protein
MSGYRLALSAALWLGILFDWLVGLGGTFAPEATVDRLGPPLAPADRAWAAFAFMLTFLLSLFFVPGARDVDRYRVSVWLAVGSRLPQAAFFLLLYPGQYPSLGLVYLLLLVVQAPLFLLLRREERRVQRGPAGAGIGSTWKGDGAVGETPGEQIFEYEGSTFTEVKDVAFSGRYDTLPLHRGLGLRTMLQFFNGSARNLADRRDIRPYFDKLIHSNGICYTGVWRIDQPSPYTGYFATGAEGLILARLSVAGPRPTQGHKRAFGIAGKVFPTMDPHLQVKPGNFVTVNILSGTKDRHITDAEVTNMPEIGPDPAANVVNRVIFRLMDSRPGYRRLHPISTLGVPYGGKVVTPDLMLLKVAEGTPRVDAKDFRDELRLSNYPAHRLVYTINVKAFAEPEWTRLGVIEFDDDAISEGGDKRLHFWIPSDIPSRN